MPAMSVRLPPCVFLGFQFVLVYQFCITGSHCFHSFPDSSAAMNLQDRDRFVPATMYGMLESLNMNSTVSVRESLMSLR